MSTKKKILIGFCIALFVVINLFTLTFVKRAQGETEILNQKALALGLGNINMKLSNYQAEHGSYPETIDNFVGRSSTEVRTNYEYVLSEQGYGLAGDYKGTILATNHTGALFNADGTPYVPKKSFIFSLMEKFAPTEGSKTVFKELNSEKPISQKYKQDLQNLKETHKASLETHEKELEELKTSIQEKIK